MFGTIMTVIVVLYVLWYGGNFIHDLFFDKSSEVVVGVKIEEKPIDIDDTVAGMPTYSVGESDIQPANSSNNADNEASEDSAEEVSGGVEVDDLDKQIQMTGEQAVEKLGAMYTTVKAA